MTQPYIGAPVNYIYGQGSSRQVYAAIITAIFGAGTSQLVNVTVFLPDGTFQHHTSIRFGTANNEWQWPVMA